MRLLKAYNPISLAKALFPSEDPVELFTRVVEDNDGYIGGTIRIGSAGSDNGEFGSEFVDKGVSRDKSGPKEKFSFGDLTFDIDAAKRLCGGKSNEMAVVDEKWSIKINVDKIAAMRSTSTNPVIIAQVPTKKGLVPLLIDGHHRMYKATQDEKKEVEAYLMTPEETLFILDTHPDMLQTLTKNLRDMEAHEKLDNKFVKAKFMAKIPRAPAVKFKPSGRFKPHEAGYNEEKAAWHLSQAKKLGTHPKAATHRSHATSQLIVAARKMGVGKPHQWAAGKMAKMGSNKMKKSTRTRMIDWVEKAKGKKRKNPDLEADAKLGEKVEHDVEQHFKANAAAEKKEGHKLRISKSANKMLGWAKKITGR